MLLQQTKESAAGSMSPTPSMANKVNVTNFGKIVAEYLFNISTLVHICWKRFSSVTLSGKYSEQYFNFKDRL